MKDPANDFQTFYKNMTGKNAFVGILPTTVDECIAFISSGGYSPLDTQNPAEKSIRRPTVQVRVRGNVNDYIGARELVEEVFNIFHRKSFTVNNTNYIDVIAVGEPNWLGYDENNRPEFSLNFEAMM